MILKTVHFGDIELEEANVFHFEEGVFGFPHEKKYVVVRNPDPELPFDWLQSVETPELAFVITDPFFFKKEYEFDVPEAIQESLDIWDPGDVLIYAITVIHADIKISTMNLRAPLILNTRTKLGSQIILENENYPVKFRLFPDEEGA